MKLFAALAATLLFAPPAIATPSPGDSRQAEILGEFCEEGFNNACRELAKITKGNCAAPAGSGCKYDSRVFTPVDKGLMVNVPGIGYSRVETLTFCLNVTGVDKYQDLLTDSEFLAFEDCMADNT
jgi:hypothetical protein